MAGLRLRLRLDRIDRLDNGHFLLIDYKSGEQTRPKLEGERPLEPQLLVYAAAVQEEVDGIFFGQLKPRELKAVGFSRDETFLGSDRDRAKGLGFLSRALPVECGEDRDRLYSRIGGRRSR